MPTTPAKKTVAKKAPARRPVRKPVQDIPMPEIDVLDLHSQDAEDERPDLAEVFRLDGKPYFIDRNRGAGVAMKMLKLIRTEGENAAMANFLLDVLGDDAFDALSNFPGVKVAQLQTVMLACTKALLGDKDAGPKV
jgi:hypothetical protein